MSGHSKWNNIKRKKEKTDAQKAKIYTKIGRELAVIVKMGGADPESNAKLKDAIAKAKANNMPNDNIMRCIKKAAGENDNSNYEEIIYEGYGPSGVAVMVETLTDNRNRTAGDMRHYFDKCGGNLGQNGCVGYLFDRTGVIVIEKGSIDEDELTMAALDAGASDLNAEDEYYEILTDPDDVWKVAGALDAAGYTTASVDVDRIPQTTVTLSTDDELKNMNKLIDMLEDNDDVQNVYHNWDAPEEE